MAASKGRPGADTRAELDLGVPHLRQQSHGIERAIALEGAVRLTPLLSFGCARAHSGIIAASSLGRSGSATLPNCAVAASASNSVTMKAKTTRRPVFQQPAHVAVGDGCRSRPLRAQSFNTELGWEFCESSWNSQFSGCRSACFAAQISCIEEGTGRDREGQPQQEILDS